MISSFACSFRRFTKALLPVIVLLTTFRVAAALPSQLIEFNIAPQPLDTALAAYSKQSGVEIIYDSALAKHRYSPGVVAKLQALEGLKQLLGDNGLVPRFTGSGVITLKLAAEPGKVLALGALEVDAQSLIGSNHAHRQYGVLLARAATDYINKRDESGQVQCSADLSIWVDANGRIERVVLNKSSGIDYMEAPKIADELMSLRIPAPPPHGLVQPVRIRLTSRAMAAK